LRTLYFSLAARQDLAEIARYVSDAAGPSTAAFMVIRIRDTCRLIADTPGEIGVVRPEIRAGVRSFPVAPYVLFFRYTADEVEVVRVLHGRRDVEALFAE
jgi:toxin ParE1/3/4